MTYDRYDDTRITTSACRTPSIARYEHSRLSSNKTRYMHLVRHASMCVLLRPSSLLTFPDIFSLASISEWHANSLSCTEICSIVHSRQFDRDDYRLNAIKYYRDIISARRDFNSLVFITDVLLRGNSVPDDGDLCAMAKISRVKHRWNGIIFRE